MSYKDKIQKIQKLGGEKLTLLLIATIVVSVVINIALSVTMLGILRMQFPDEQAQYNYKQQVTHDLLEHSRHLALELDVLDRPAVQKALADFNYDVEVSRTREDIIQVIINYPRKLQDIVLREWETSLREQIISIINQDAGIRNLNENARLTLRVSAQSINEEPYRILNQISLARISEVFAANLGGREISMEIEIVDGEARNVVAGDPAELIQALTKEVDSLRSALRDLRIASGHAEMNGPGLRVRIYDQAGVPDNPSIVHDTDIRDVVNELFSSGAQGISVGGHRLTVTSAIRCSGPLIKVDDRLISVNPVEILAVGNTDVMRSGLDIIRNTMKINRGLIFEISKMDNITLTAIEEQ